MSIQFPSNRGCAESLKSGFERFVKNKIRTLLIPGSPKVIRRHDFVRTLRLLDCQEQRDIVPHSIRNMKSPIERRPGYNLRRNHFAEKLLVIKPESLALRLLR